MIKLMNARILVSCRGVVSESLETCEFLPGELYPVDTLDPEFVALRVPHLLSGQVALVDRENVALEEEPAPAPAPEAIAADQHERQREALAELVRAAEMYATTARPRLGKLCKEARAALADWEPNYRTRAGQPWRVVVEVRGGSVQDVTAPKGAVVEVRDYDSREEWGESPNVCIWNGCGEEVAQ